MDRHDYERRRAALCDRYHHLFALPHLPDATEAGKAFGMGPADLTERIYIEIEPGWLGTLERLLAQLDALPNPPHISQVKEKWGLLTVYVYGGDPEVDGLIEASEEESGRTCQRCGDSRTAKGRRIRGWLFTLCDGCAAKQIRRDANSGK